MKNTNYYTVQGWMVNELKLSGNELLIYAVIFGFTQDGRRFKGGLQYIADTIGVSKRSVSRLMKQMCEKGIFDFEPKDAILYEKREYWITDAYSGTRTISPRGTTNCPKRDDKLSIDNTIDNTRDKTTPPSAPASDSSSLKKPLPPEKKNPANKKINFRNSFYHDFKNVIEYFKINSQKYKQYAGVDFRHYYDSIDEWSDTKDIKRTDAGWISTFRSWMRRDYGNGELVMRKTTKNKTWGFNEIFQNS